MLHRTLLYTFLIFLLLHVIAQTSFAQTDAGNRDSIFHEYIENYNDLLTFKMSLGSKEDGFDLENTSRYKIRSNNKTKLNAGINYRWLAFSLTFAPNLFNENVDHNIKGETKSFGFGFSSNFHHIIQKINYSRVKGYYLDNTNAFDPTWKAGDPYIHLPGLIFRSFSGQTAYKFNDNFSFNAINSQTERQVKSAGTFLPSVSYQHFVVKDPTPLPGQSSSQKSKTLEVVFSPGYYYTLVTPSHLYASAGVSPGIGFSRTKLLTRESSGNAGTIYKRTVYQVESVLTFGYDSRRFFTGIQITTGAYGYSHTNGDYAILPQRGSGSLFIGYRFNAPKKLTAAMDKAEKLAADKLQELKEKVQQ
ncbi:DUF4421 domain-containing protein [Ginsengibacter hankyongi]|uniref:DUF4421 domain-containing protein n=1 Tax=Ginsengibacter hankyongi TaxID=2607284 RepID=A0A5J5IJW4_9BACT|nr:DUF4421 family protein [Ginsengibacter hankyongi]KAA9040818.1 DUF4421 domain-containing protein [Ginsengibacter hankyongi]